MMKSPKNLVNAMIKKDQKSKNALIVSKPSMPSTPSSGLKNVGAVFKEIRKDGGRVSIPRPVPTPMPRTLQPKPKPISPPRLSIPKPVPVLPQRKSVIRTPTPIITPRNPNLLPSTQVKNVAKLSTQVQRRY